MLTCWPAINMSFRLCFQVLVIEQTSLLKGLIDAVSLFFLCKHSYNNKLSKTKIEQEAFIILFNPFSIKYIIKILVTNELLREYVMARLTYYMYNLLCSQAVCSVPAYCSCRWRNFPSKLNLRPGNQRKTRLELNLPCKYNMEVFQLLFPG